MIKRIHMAQGTDGQSPLPALAAGALGLSFTAMALVLDFGPIGFVDVEFQERTMAYQSNGTTGTDHIEVDSVQSGLGFLSVSVPAGFSGAPAVDSVVLARTHFPSPDSAAAGETFARGIS